MWLANMFLGSSALNWRYIAVNKLLLDFSNFFNSFKTSRGSLFIWFLRTWEFFSISSWSLWLSPSDKFNPAQMVGFKSYLIDKKFLFFSSKIFSCANYYLKTGNASSQGLRNLNSRIFMSRSNYQNGYTTHSPIKFPFFFTYKRTTFAISSLCMVVNPFETLI